MHLYPDEYSDLSIGNSKLECLVDLESLNNLLEIF